MITQPSGAPVVALEGLTQRFGHAVAVDNVSLAVQPGDIFGLLGLNGAGKTTSLRILLGLLRPTSGRVQLFGKPRREAWLELGDRIGAMIESPAFYPHLTGRQNLEMLHRLAHRRREGRKPGEALEMTGLADAADVRVRKYSMGMTQRLYLAQALLNSPELLVLDEPTSNLDPQGITDVRKLIRRLNAEGVTIILSSHQLGEVEEVCNRVGIIHRGRLVAEASVRELFKSDESRMEIHTKQAGDATRFINSLDWVRGAVHVEDTIRVHIPRARRAELNALLVAQGFAIDEFTERKPSLEDFFHEKISRDAPPSVGAKEASHAA